jgi:dihydropteroate synthase/2-amino-4-hydroxy-6-hydroxymethyldihydropteridine diphosphokinase
MTASPVVYCHPNQPIITTTQQKILYFFIVIVVVIIMNVVAATTTIITAKSASIITRRRTGCFNNITTSTTFIKPQRVVGSRKASSFLWGGGGRDVRATFSTLPSHQSSNIDQRRGPSSFCRYYCIRRTTLHTIRGGATAAMSSSHHDNNNHRPSSSPQQDQHHLSHCVYIAVGSNLGDRHFNIRKGLDLLCSPEYDPETYEDTQLIKTSFLYHTAPMYVTDQPPFLNGAIQIETNLPPLKLLKRMKRIERDLGRNFTQIRNGPRPLDLDILLYYNQTTSAESANDNTNTHDTDVDVMSWEPWFVNETEPVELFVPHPRMAEREFVLAPLVDLAGHDFVYPTTTTINVVKDNNTAEINTSNDNNDKSESPVEAETAQPQDTTTVTIGSLLAILLDSHGDGQGQDQCLSSSSSSSSSSPLPPAASRLIPLPLGRYMLFPTTPDSVTLIMGILNVTPDSFSDGGHYNTNVTKAVDQAFQMVQDGATIIDIGGESTRPGAKEVSVEEQIQRIVPVIVSIRAREQQQEQHLKADNVPPPKTPTGRRVKIVNSDVDAAGSEEEKSSSIVISVDTRHAAVARAAISAGADIVNDVSGGTFDPEMLPTVAELGVPIIMMHMRGTPETMQCMTDYGSGDNDDDDDGSNGVVDAVIEALLERSNAASLAGIPRWMQILDVGIGFAKDFDGNLSLLKHYRRIRSETGGIPLVLGTSRKGFLGKIAGETVASDRDFATVGSCVATICLGGSMQQNDSNNRIDLGCNILRVHNVKALHQATLVMDAIVNHHK